MGHVQLQSLMNYLTFAGGDVGANLVTGSVDKPYADYVLRNCSKPTDPKLLDPFGSPVYDSLKVADGFAAEEPYVNQLRFLLTAPANLKNEKMQLELLNPQINEGVTLTQTPFNNAVLSGRYLHSKTDYLNFTPVPSSYEVFAGWLLEDLQWEQISPTEIQAKVVINVPYIPGYMDSSGNPITRKIYARVVPQASSSAWISSNTLGIGIVHKDYCADEYALVEKVKQQQAAEGVLFDLITHYNISHPPYSAEVVGYEPPVIATGIAQCTAGDYGRFVHVKLGCAKEFGPYKGKGSVPDTSFAFYTGDMVYTFNNPKGSSTGSTLSALSSKYPKS